MTQPPKSADEIVDEPFRPSSPQPRAFLILGAMETMTNTNNLLPCPFCGGEPKYEVWSDRNYHKAECVDCAFEFDYCQTYEELEASWNKRVAPAPCLHQIQEPAPVQACGRSVLPAGCSLERDGRKLPELLALRWRLHDELG